MGKFRNDADWKDIEMYTSLQWANKGMVVIEGAQGVTLWANRGCQRGKYTYYKPEEVRIGTAEELADFFRSRKEHQNKLSRLRREKQKKELEALRLEVQSYRSDQEIERRIAEKEREKKLTEEMWEHERRIREQWNAEQEEEHEL